MKKQKEEKLKADSKNFLEEEKRQSKIKDIIKKTFDEISKKENAIKKRSLDLKNGKNK